METVFLNMSGIKPWILAARLRTLPLSISGILVGTGMALRDDFFDWCIFIFALITTIGFQILSNFANDYGDGIKGTDNEDRVGPARALQSGLLTAVDLKKGMWIMALFTVITSLLVIYYAFGSAHFKLSLLFFVLGLAAIAAAIKYTVGKSAYGYRGLGDVFVFIFFGLLGVMGSYFLFTQQIPMVHILPAITIGLLSVAVLNLNNMRDRVEDEKVGKRTLAVLLGAAKSKWYHFAVLGMALSAWVSYLFLTASSPVFYLTLIPFVMVIVHGVKVARNTTPQALDPELKKIALTTFGLSILFICISAFN